MFGIIRYPRIHIYRQKDIQFDLIAQAITRDSFFLLRSCLHFVDINNRPPQAEIAFEKLNQLSTAYVILV